MSGETKRTTEAVRISYTTDNGYVNNDALTDSFVLAHYHSIFTEPHSHEVDIPDHTHSFTMAAHEHNFEVPAHSHDIIPGIYEFGDAKSFSIYVNGTKKASYVGKTAELNITDYLLGDDKRIPRGSWMSIEVRPDDLAYISIDLVFQGFVQSRGDAAV